MKSKSICSEEVTFFSFSRLHSDDQRLKLFTDSAFRLVVFAHCSICSYIHGLFKSILCFPVSPNFRKYLIPRVFNFAHLDPIFLRVLNFAQGRKSTI